MSDKWIPNPSPFPTRPPSEWPAATPGPPPEPPTEPDPDAPEPAERTGTRAMILAVIGVALLAAIATYAVLRVVRPAKKQVDAPMTTVAPLPTTTTTLPQGPKITSAELRRLVDELVPYIEQTRQLPFVTHPTTLLEDDATYDAAFAAYLARSKGLLERLTSPFDLLGLNPNDADMATALQAFHGDRTVVFYDAVHDIVHVRTVPATPYLSTMLVVGLTEELDDQYFTTDAVASPQAFGDATFGLSTLVGGDSWRIASAWASTQSLADQSQIRAELKARRGDDGDTAKIPAALATWLRYPADSGVTFTSNLVTARSSAALDAVFRSPPDGSAQVLSPARVAAKITQLPVAAPEVEGKVQATGTFGRFFLEAMLTPVVDDDTLMRAMNGYRGDSLVAYENASSQSCAQLQVTTADVAPDNMHKAFTTWAAQRNGTVSLVADPDRPGRRLVHLEVCSGGEGSPDSTTTTTPGGASGSNPSSTIPRGPRP